MTSEKYWLPPKTEASERSTFKLFGMNKKLVSAAGECCCAMSRINMIAQQRRLASVGSWCQMPIPRRSWCRCLPPPEKAADRSAWTELLTHCAVESLDRWELYDLEADRTEQTNLATAEPDVVAELRSLYEAWAERCGVKPWPIKQAKR